MWRFVLNPSVTVLLPVRNGARWLAEAVDSVLKQTYDAWTLLVLDDGSMDGSVAVAHEACLGDARCYVVPMGHLGLTAVLRAGVEMSWTPWIARLDADDQMMPDRLSTQIRVAEEGEFAILGSSVEVDGKMVYYPAKDVECRAAMSGWRPRNPFAHSAVLFNRKAALYAGNYDPRWSYCQDLALWIEMAYTAGSRIGNLESLLTVLGTHPDQRSRHAWRRRWYGWRIALDAKRRGLNMTLAG